MTAIFIVVGGLVGWAIDITLADPHLVYSVNWTAITLGALNGFVARALFVR